MTRPYDFQDFKWLVHAEGYSWKSTARRRFLVPNPATGARPREYYPLRQDQAPRRLLFRMLVETELNEDAIQAFASTYGLLGVYDMPKSLARRATQGESLKTWEKEIRLMRQAVGLFDMVKRKDRKGLGQHFSWGKDSIYFTHPDLPLQGYRQKRILFASVEHRPHVLRQSLRGDLFQPALYQIREIVNEQLRHRVDIKVLLAPNKRVGVYHVPNSLIGALWLQLAQIVAGIKSQEQCERCGQWFEVSEVASRTNRKYCSDACKAKAYRKRGQAQLLRKAGLSVNKIAKELQVNTSIVKSWMKERKR